MQFYIIVFKFNILTEICQHLSSQLGITTDGNEISPFHTTNIALSVIDNYEKVALYIWMTSVVYALWNK